MKRLNRRMAFGGIIAALAALQCAFLALYRGGTIGLVASVALVIGVGLWVSGYDDHASN